MTSEEMRLVREALFETGKDGQPGRVDLVIDGALRVLETYEMPDGRVGVCFTPGRK